MTRRASLTTRAFLLSFLPVCIVLGATFFTLSTLAERRVKERLIGSLRDSEESLARANERSRLYRLVAACCRRVCRGAGYCDSLPGQSIALAARAAT